MNPRPRILILDDDPTVCEFLTSLLEHEGVAIEWADNSDAALALVRTHRFDVLLSDIGHPGLDGIDLLPVWAQLHPNMPVIILSGSLDMNNNHSQALALGAFACIHKPFSSEEVLAAIRAALSLRP